MMRKASLVIVAVTLAAAAVTAQTTPPRFEVASVKAVAPLAMDKVLAGQQASPGATRTPGRLDMIGVPLGALLTSAFKVRPTSITGPSWLILDPVAQIRSGERRFDIRATLPAGTTEEHVPEMLQALLVERFKLAFHRERREVEVLAMVVGPKGHTLTAASPTAAPAGRPQISPRNGVVRIEQPNVTMPRLANLLTTLVGKQVVDQTAMPGAYAVAFELAPSDMPGFARAAAAAGVSSDDLRRAGADAPSGSGSAFRSLEDLGLKLEPRRVGIDQIVIDHLEAMPTPD